MSLFWHESHNYFLRRTEYNLKSRIWFFFRKKLPPWLLYNVLLHLMTLSPSKNSSLCPYLQLFLISIYQIRHLLLPCHPSICIIRSNARLLPSAPTWQIGGKISNDHSNLLAGAPGKGKNNSRYQYPPEASG